MRINMKAIVALTLIPWMLLASFPVIQDVSAVGLTTSNMLIKIFYDQTAESWALETGDIDMNDWPLTKDFISKWTGRTDITMQEYSAIDMFQIDINNQWWPTGSEDPSHSTAAPRNVFYDGNQPRHKAALHFRRAIAHLSDKDAYVTYMGGQAYKIETEVPVPALAGYVDYTTLENATAVAERGDNPFATGFLYRYSVGAAKKELELGGFGDYDGDGYVEWNKNYPSAWRNASDTEELPNMKMWIQIDHPYRRYAAESLYNQMTGAVVTGLPVGWRIPPAAATDARGLDKVVTERSTFFNNVMVLFKYNFYTGNWGDDFELTWDPDFLFNLYHSSMGQYAWCQNYPGFKNHEFDTVVEKVKYAPDMSSVRFAVINAQWLMAKYVPVIPLWSSKGVKAFRTGWEGVVNMAGYGVDNGYSFMLMNWVDGPGTSRRGPDNTIVYGFKSDISALHVVSSDWGWDWKVLRLVYDSLIDVNPFDLSEDEGELSSAGLFSSPWRTGTWSASSLATVTFKVPDGEEARKWPDSQPVTTEDVRFSILMQKAAGPGVAWNYPSVMEVDHVETYAENPDLRSNEVKVYFGVQGVWALHWIGRLPILRKSLWMAAIGPGTAANYQESADPRYPGTFGNAMAVRDYRSWEMDVFNAATGGRGADGVIDLKQDGAGPWVFNSYTPGQTISLTVNTGYYRSMEEISSLVNDAFHRLGDVDFDGIVDGDDRYTIATSIPSSDVSSPFGNGELEYYAAADLNRDGTVDVTDRVIVNMNYLRQIGMKRLPAPMWDYEKEIEIDYKAGHRPDDTVLQKIREYFFPGKMMTVTFNIDDEISLQDWQEIDADQETTNDEYGRLQEKYNDGKDRATWDPAKGKWKDPKYKSKRQYILFGERCRLPDASTPLGYSWTTEDKTANTLAGNYIFISHGKFAELAGTPGYEQATAQEIQMEVLMHEIGHCIGQDHDASGVMVESGDQYNWNGTLDETYSNNSWQEANLDYYKAK